MKRFLIAAAALYFGTASMAQEKVYTYEFKDVKVNPATSVKNQATNW